MPRPARVCRVDGCDNKHNRRGWCDKHATRWELAHPHLKPVCYRTAHDNVNRQYGYPTEHPCVDCGKQARDWSYNHDDPDDILNKTGHPYSLKPEHYSPRCRSCHQKFDRTVERPPVVEPPIVRWVPPSPHPSPLPSRQGV